MKVERGVCYASADEMRQIDGAAIEEYGIPEVALMENAGAATAELAVVVLGGNVEGRKIACLVGKGNNGGDGLVAARHLHAMGAVVQVLLGCEREAMGSTAAIQLKSVEKLVRVNEGMIALGGFDLAIDAFLGYNSTGSPREPIASMIRGLNQSDLRVLSVDIPSGLDTTTGVANDPCVTADDTVTLGLPKLGFLNPASKPYLGRVHLADISLPREAYAKVSATRPEFRGMRLIDMG